MSSSFLVSTVVSARRLGKRACNSVDKEMRRVQLDWFLNSGHKVVHIYQWCGLHLTIQVGFPRISKTYSKAKESFASVERENYRLVTLRESLNGSVSVKQFI